MAETVTVGGEEFPADLRVHPEESPTPETPEQPAEAAPEPEAPAEAAPPSDYDLREQLTRYAQRNRDLEDTLLRAQQFQMEQVARQQPQAPPQQQQNPLDNPQLSPEWRESLRFIDQNLSPVLEQRIAQRVAPFQQQAAEAQVATERLMLHQAAQRDQRYADYPALEPQVLAIRQQLVAARSPLASAPLEAIYAQVKFATQQQANAQQVAQAEQRGSMRARAAANGQVTTAAPASSGRTPGLSIDRLPTMSTQELEQEIKRGLASGNPAWRLG